MSKKFPYGYDVNAYIDKAFEQMNKVYSLDGKFLRRVGEKERE